MLVKPLPLRTDWASCRLRPVMFGTCVCEPSDVYTVTLAPRDRYEPGVGESR